MKCEWCNEEKPMTHECIVCHAKFCCLEHAEEHFKRTILFSSTVKIQKITEEKKENA